MIYKNKNGRYYLVKFIWKGKLYRKSTRATNAKTARSIEGRIRSELAQGNFGILEPKPKPTLEEFLKKDFLRFVEATFKKAKPNTLRYYEYGVKSLLSTNLSKLPIDIITDQHAKQYAARNSKLSPSTINCGLRTLRRALNLAVDWGVLDKVSRIRLAKGEKRRERVLSKKEREPYLNACRQPWQDIAVLLLGTGMRPGEAFALRWENLLLQQRQGLINISKGKSEAARRVLPMVPRVLEMLKRRHEELGYPAEGWVFPSNSKSGHVERDSLKRAHQDALKKSNVAPFPPYCLRHTALTNLAILGCDPFTLAKIAGHSSITVTERYCHPQADAIERAFTEMAQSQKAVTEGGHHENQGENGLNIIDINVDNNRDVVGPAGLEPATR
jgi:integrase